MGKVALRPASDRDRHREVETGPGPTAFENCVDIKVERIRSKIERTEPGAKASPYDIDNDEDVLAFTRAFTQSQTFVVMYAK
ncbi:hypothetical protein EVAR_63458_1 [Eumeta japonica]|uniref:Uncharacterized protein n=1 Tax=Eumeta variegata TaxID=151549 RepID=A0A4C1YEL0_EUMVA|nr:hypothetical protein EVAR_63458_1 [Eumeta japonica]